MPDFASGFRQPFADRRGDPIQGVDPSGEVLQLVSALLPGPSDFILGGLQALVQAYIVNLEWDTEWAFDFSMPDDWGSRSDNSWVASALMAGVRDAFRISIPFTNIGFNPVDLFAPFASESGTGLGGMLYDEWVDGAPATNLPNGVFANRGFGSRNPRNSVGSAVRLVNGRKATFSEIVPATTAAEKPTRVGLFTNGKGRDVAMFPNTLSPKKLQGAFKAPGYADQTPNGKPWSKLSPGDIKKMRNQDVASVKKKLDSFLGKGNWSSPSKNSGLIKIDGVEYTIHHHHKKGHFQLVEYKVHRDIGHVGIAMWHNR